MRNEVIELLPGEEICPKCEGIGEVLPSGNEHWRTRICKRCWGEGKLDWIEMAMGKKVPHFEGSSSSSSSSSNYPAGHLSSCAASTTTINKGVYHEKQLRSGRVRDIGHNFRQFYAKQKRSLERKFHKTGSR